MTLKTSQSFKLLNMVTNFYHVRLNDLDSDRINFSVYQKFFIVKLLERTHTSFLITTSDIISKLFSPCINYHQITLSSETQTLEVNQRNSSINCLIFLLNPKSISSPFSLNFFSTSGTISIYGEPIPNKL